MGVCFTQDFLFVLCFFSKKGWTFMQTLKVQPCTCCCYYTSNTYILIALFINNFFVKLCFFFYTCMYIRCINVALVQHLICVDFNWFFFLYLFSYFFYFILLRFLCLFQCSILVIQVAIVVNYHQQAKSQQHKIYCYCSMQHTSILKAMLFVLNTKKKKKTVKLYISK